jgi:hypothetical protein
MILIDKNLCGHLQELAGIHSSKSLQFLQFSLYVSLDLADKSGIYHPLVFSGFQIKGGAHMGSLHNHLLNCLGPSAGPWRTSLLSLMFMTFSPPSFMPPRMPPDPVQAAGNLGHHWGPIGVFLGKMSLSVCLGI